MHLSRRRLLALTGTAALAPALPMTHLEPASARAASSRPDAAAAWFDQTITAAGETGSDVSQRRTWAIGWLSAQRALDAAALIPHSQRPRFEDAAVATAVHDVLVDLAPGRKDVLDGALEASLDAIADGPGKRAGKRAGRQAAARTLSERVGDGHDPDTVNRTFPDPPPAPGVYQRPADATTPNLLAGMGQARPFMLGEASRFRPGPPPALDTNTYRRDLDEARTAGSADATDSERSRAQTDTALLWAQPALRAYTPALDTLVTDQRRPLAWKVRLLAAFSVATVDAGIAVAEAKYAYLWWRPITAIRATGIDEDWRPLRPTPAHPEYPSGHAGYAGAAEQVLEHFTGPHTPVPFTITNTSQAVSREYRRGTPWSAITQEVIDARVWLGVHHRTTDEISAALGRQVAAYDLARLA